MSGNLSQLRRPRGGFRTVVADPPWPYNDRLPGGGRGAAKHYDLMTLADISWLGNALQEKLADDAHLYLWTTNAFMAEAWNVTRAWGFVPKTLLTWVKIRGEESTVEQRLDISGRLQIGMGRYYRNCTEHLVFAVRGKLPPAHRGLPTVFFAPRTEHSRKPEVAYDFVEAMSPGPRLDMFARQQRKGWTVWGNGVEQ